MALAHAAEIAAHAAWAATRKRSNTKRADYFESARF